MGKGTRLTLYLGVAFLVFGAGVVMGKVDDRWKPVSSGTRGFFNGNELYSWDKAAQVYYVAGVLDAYFTVWGEFLETAKQPPIPAPTGSVKPPDPAMATMIKLVSAGAAIPSDANLGQIFDVVLAYLKDHPEERHNGAALLVWRALAQADWK